MSKNARRFASPWERGRPTRYSGTQIEQKLARCLATLGLEGEDWQRQFRADDVRDFRNHAFDFAFPGKRVLIEADGCFHHGCPRCCPSKGPRQRDHWIDNSARAAGYVVLRFFGCRIKSDMAGIRREIAQAIGLPT